MPELLLEVSSDKDISESRWIPFDLSASQFKMIFVDKESHEVVEILYWINGEIFSSPHGDFLF